MNLQAFRQEYPAYDDVSDADLTDMLHKSVFSDLPREEFEAVFLGAQEEEQEAEEPAEGQALPLEYTSNDVKTDPNRLNFEIGLMKNKKTSKFAVLLPPDITGAEAVQIAKAAGVRVLQQGGDIYLYDPRQITEMELRRQIAQGKNGQALGYGTDTVPENGIPYAVDLDGNGTVDAADIIALRDSGQLGFSGVAPDMDGAVAKIREMGRDDAEVRGMPEPLINDSP